MNENPNGKKFEIVAVSSLLLGLLVLFLVFNSLSPLLLWDENAYLGNARSHIAQSNFTEDFRPPLLEWLIALVWLPAESILTAKILIILMTLGTVFFTHLILREHFPERKSFFVTLSFALSALIIFWGFRIYADVPALFFIVVSFYCLLKKEKLGENGKKASVLIALAGITSALAFLTRFTSALFPLAVGVYYIFKKKYKDLAIFSVFFILALLPWLAYNQIHYQNPVWDFKEQYSGVEQWTHWEPAIKHVKNLFMSVGLLAFLLPFGIFSLLRKKDNKKLVWLILIYVAVSLVYYFFFVKMKDIRYYIPFLPFLYLMAFDGFFWLESKINRQIIRKIAWVVITLNVAALFLSTSVYIAKSSAYERNGSLYKSIVYLKEKNAYSPKIFSNAWPWFGYHLNAKATGLWTEDIDELARLTNFDYIVYDSVMGAPFNKTILDVNKRLHLEKEITDKYNHNVYVYSLTKTSQAGG